MTSDRWARLKEAFGVAIDSGGAGTDLLSDDPELRDELIDLLADHHSGATFLDNPRWGVLTLDGLDGLDGAGLDAAGVDTPEAELLSPGQRVAGYVIEQLIGRGGMGEVYRATQDRPRRVVALKVIRAGLSSPRARLRLEAEADLLARLDHPGIARVIESGFLMLGEAEGRHPPSPFFSMEFVDGVPINVFARDHRLDPAAIVELTRQVCEAVEHAHRRGIIHRDIKPDNILVGSDGLPRVLDFGVARAIDRGIDCTLTQPGGMPGTPAYMSPEQLSGGADAVDTRSDVYSLGVVLYELLTGRLPFPTENRSFIELIRAIMDDPAPLPSSVAPAGVASMLKGDLDIIIMAATEKDLSRRYGSVAALAEDLGRLLRHEPILKRSAGFGYSLGKLLRRHRVASVAVAAGFAALVIGLSVAGWQFVRAVDAEHLAKDRLAEIRRASAELVSDISAKLWTFQSTAEVRQYLAGESMRRLEAMLAVDNDDPQVLWDLSTACIKLGEASGNPGMANAGDRATALAMMRRGIAMRERLLAASPQNRSYRLHLAGSLWHLSLIEEDAQERASLVHRSIALYQQAADEDPSDADGARDLAFAWAVEGDRLASLGQDSSEPFARSEAMMQELAVRFPNRLRWQYQLGMVMSTHAESIWRADPVAALPIFRRAREMLVDELSAGPGNYSLFRHIAKADSAEAEDLARRGEGARAINLADQATASIRGWFNNDPSDSMIRLDLVEAILSSAAVRRSASGPADRQAALALASETRTLLLRSGNAESLPREQQILLERLEGLVQEDRP